MRTCACRLSWFAQHDFEASKQWVCLYDVTNDAIHSVFHFTVRFLGFEPERKNRSKPMICDSKNSYILSYRCRYLYHDKAISIHGFYRSSRNLIKPLEARFMIQFILPISARPCSNISRHISNYLRTRRPEDAMVIWIIYTNKSSTSQIPKRPKKMRS